MAVLDRKIQQDRDVLIPILTREVQVDQDVQDVNTKYIELINLPFKQVC